MAFEAEGHGDYSYDSGFKEASVILHRSKVDALVCGNDVMAIGARDAATRMLKLQVPRDLAIVGQDGIAMARWGCHDLTTVATDQVALVDAERLPKLPGHWTKERHGLGPVREQVPCERSQGRNGFASHGRPGIGSPH